MSDDYELTFMGRLVATPDEGEVDFDRDATIEEAFSATQAELFELAGSIDPMVSGSVTSGVIEITLTVQAETFPEATARADNIVRTALHAAGVGTKNWPADGSSLFVDFTKVTTQDPNLADCDDDDLVDA